MQTLGRYQLSDRLGQGGMGVVYRAFDTLLQRVVAVKVIGTQMDDNPEMRERFFREARAAGQLSHENIIIIHDLGEQDGHPFLAMEYLEGSDLQQRLADPVKMSLRRKLEVAMALCEGLEYAHAHGVVHRDVKPANVFITTSGQVKILDFGLARLMTSQLTNSNTLMGTLNYMAPEQVRGERADHRADVFSVGVVIYELLGNRKAFEGDSFASTLYKILQEVPEPLWKIDATLPRGLTAIVERALAKPLDERYQSVSALREDLQAFCGQVDRPGSGGASRQPVSAYATADSATDKPSASNNISLPGARKPTGTRPFVVASAIVVAVAASGAVWFAARRPAPAASAPARAEQPATPPAAPVESDRSAKAPPPVDSAAHTTQPVQQGAAAPSGQGATDARSRMADARERARAANAATLAAAAYRRAVRTEQEAQRLFDRGRITDATARYYEASGLYQSAALSAQAQRPSPTPPEVQRPATRTDPVPSPEPAKPVDLPSAPPSAPPPSTEPLPAPPNAAPAPAPPPPARPVVPAEDTPARGPSPEEGITQLLTSYKSALEGKNLEALKRLWPNLSGGPADALRNEFQHASRINVDIVDPRISATNGTGAVTFRRRYELLTVDGQRLRSETRTTIDVRRTPGGWIIESVRFSPVR